MKTSIIMLFVVLLIPTLSAQVNDLPAEKKSAAVDNLTMGIESNNTGLKTSAALVLFDLIEETYLKKEDATKALIPLLTMLENGKSDEERIAAAVALFQLGNAVGIYHLRGVAVFDENKKVANICKNLYYSYHKLNGTEYLVQL